MRRCASGQSRASSGRRITGSRDPHVSGVLTTELEKSRTGFATPAYLRSSSRIPLHAESSSAHEPAAIRPSRKRPIASHPMTARKPITHTSGSNGIAVEMSRASPGGCAPLASITFAFNAELLAEGPEFVTVLALGRGKLEAVERGRTGTLHCGDNDIANGSATPLARAAKRMR